MKGSLIILAFFSAGVLGGVFNIFPDWILNEDLTSYTLYALMFLVGISIGSDKGTFYILKKMKLKVLLVPGVVITGSLAGTALISVFIPSIRPNEAMAVGAGFGYYSLSSIIISELHSQELGVIALLSNILREITTLLAVPLMIKYFGKLAGIASGGATAMDTTLPVIVKFTGKEFGIISVFSGIILTAIVPILVTLLLELF
ncbi:MAG: lysine exporter LysO family protein [Chlorobi bacterium]|nr:lysine exporter LysO family protein [Chlorobiota bacterium]